MTGVGARAYSRRTLAFLMLLAFGLRLGWMLSQTTAIENEGAEYARIAQHLVHGEGYRGILDGPETLFPPLYPSLIAGVSFITKDAETAGRLVSVVLGTLILLPMFLIGRQLFGSKTAYIVAALTALHPLLVALSASVYVETLYLTLLLAGLYCALRALEFDDLQYAILCGFFLGLDYLARPEALAYVLLAEMYFVANLVFRDAQARSTAKYISAVALTTLVFVVPYTEYLSVRSGFFRMEGKGAIVAAVNARMDQGMPYQEAAYGLSSNLQEEGPVMVSDQFSIRRPRTKAAFHSYFHGIGRRAVHVIQAVCTDRSFGSPLICLLVLVGIFQRWPERKWFEEVWLLSAAALTLAVVISVRYLWGGRYMWPFLPFLILWAGLGITTVSGWTAARFPKQKYSRLATEVVLATAVLLLAVKGLPSQPDLVESKASYLKQAGLWLNNHKPGPKKLMAVGSTLPYYANATQIYLPYADSSLALAYVHQKRPDFIALQEDELQSRPYEREWFERAVPDPCAELILQTQAPVFHRIKIYLWTCKR